MTSLFKSEVD